MQVASVTPNGLALVKNDAFVLIGEPWRGKVCCHIRRR